VITPICPHVLTNRSTVVSDRSVIEVHLFVPKQKVFVSVDGRSSRAMQVGDILRVARAIGSCLSSCCLGALVPVLRQKLKWSGSNV
jgi:NAD+ kinase